jgi:tetratricopeptide (TPR) repeat protein
VKHQLQHGVDHADLAEVLAARARFQTLAGLQPKDALLSYWVAVADWRATGLLLNGPHPDREQAKRHCQAGIAAAARAFELDPKFGGALAVKAGLLGMSTTFLEPGELMTVGALMEGDLGRAIGLADDDPRVSLIDGINTLHKPAFVGGGARPALGKLKRAIEAYGAEHVTDPAAPDWGKDDAYLWAGRASMQLKDYAGAVRYFGAALEANPENGWVRGTLLPEARRAAARDSTPAGAP